MESLLNPQTGDYTGEVASTLANAVYLRLQTPLGSYWADKNLGSRLHELAREKDVQRVRILAVQYAEDALAPLLDNGSAGAVVVTPEQPHDGTLLLIIEVTDNTGNTETFRHPVKVM